MNRFAILVLPFLVAVQPLAANDRYVVLDQELTRLIDDFNGMSDKVRLLFISGPTCGICLRGLADLNDAFIAARQGDPRLHTFVLHVPTLDAEERHVGPSIQLLEGPRVSHYWDPHGRSGLGFQRALGLPIYAWDVWLIYPPGVRWTQGEDPPEPDFWQHQLGGLKQGEKLDPEIFAAETIRRVEALDFQAQPTAVARNDRPPTLIKVDQPRGVMIGQNLEARGGYARLKQIRGIEAIGTIEVGGQPLTLALELARPDVVNRRVETPAGPAEASVRHGRIRYSGTGPQPLPRDVDVAILKAFELDGWLADWKDKGHKVWRLGMIKDAQRLPWVLEVEHRNGQIWQMYIDSHTGDAYRLLLMNGDGEPAFGIEYDDFRDVDGYRFAHTVRYLNGDEVLAVERYESIRIDAG